MEYISATNKRDPDMSKSVLYNGIELPEIWPPQYSQEVFKNRKCPSVPYLENPPEVIQTGIGRELFIDDFLIEKTTCHRTFHYPEKYENNPILKPETSWELGDGKYPSCACPKSGGVWFDYDKKIFRMWYEAGFLGHICYAESRDGINWERPEQDVVPGTNRVQKIGLRSDSWTVVHDYYTDDPQQRFKLFLMEPCGIARGMVMTSPDGIHWNLPVTTGCAGDRSTMFYNPFRKKWCFSLRAYIYIPELFRMRDYTEGDDFIAASQWGFEHENKAVHWAWVDEFDMPDPELGIAPQLYNLDAVPYESIMLGMYQLHFGPMNEVCQESGYPKITGLEFAYSRDGFHWSRPDRKCAIYPEKDRWDRGYVQSLGNICTVSEDKLTFYFTGFAGNPGGGERLSMYENGATGIAFLRRDGFASMDADGQGEILTRKLTFRGEHLFVNIDAPQGCLKAEILDENGNVFEGFSLADCPGVAGDSTKIEVKWQNGCIGKLSGRVVRFRFVLEQAKIYSFWVSSSPRGESRGYVAGGGPDYHAPQDI